MKRMYVYISYILSAAIIIASPSIFAAEAATGNLTAAPTAGGDFCVNTSADPDGNGNQTSLSNGTNGVEPMAAGQGLVSACKTLQENVDYLVANVPTFRSHGMENDKFDEIKKGYEEYQKNRIGCSEGHSLAANACAEGASPELASGASDVNNMLGQMTGGATGGCDAASKAMDAAKGALTAFTGACGGAKANCTGTCDKAAAGAGKVKQQAEAGIASVTCKPGASASCETDIQNYRTALQQAIAAGEQEANSGELKSMAGKSQSCNKDMGKALGSAAQGLIGMLAGMMQGDKCKEETDGKPEEDTTPPTVDKCTKAENATLPECICLKNPRTIGCSTAANEQGGGGQIGVGLTDQANVDPDTTSTNLGPGGGLNGPQPGPLSNGGPSGAGAPQGGGPGIGGGGGGSGSGIGGPEGTAAKKALNANILGGTGGGGGGMGRGMAGSAAADEKYRAYLPGGAKDPSKGLSGQDWAKEVTGQGGKSNWDKVKERYKDNRNSLISN